jgi:hypothetical protein
MFFDAAVLSADFLGDLSATMASCVVPSMGVEFGVMRASYASMRFSTWIGRATPSEVTAMPAKNTKP